MIFGVIRLIEVELEWWLVGFEVKSNENEERNCFLVSNEIRYG